TSLGSDASAAPDPNATGPGHPRANGNFPRLIARYVRERKVITLPEAIRKMTSWAATRMRIPNRGTIKEGNWADVTIFDYDKIQDRATYEQPQLSPVGIDYVLVNGQVVMEQGKHTGAKPGRVIYGPGRQIQ
ncbi:MAG: amidohydrolase family protein, partial [Acidobacteriota bacterium]|nr:amidohydrolase family protein [Acidobacteriota bacterium]